MTSYCSECVVNWHPYMAAGGVCPICGGGTSRRQEPVTDGVDELFRAARRVRADRERSEHAHKQFEEFYIAREARLNGLDQLPVTGEAA